jgi:hypothetical protein
MIFVAAITIPKNTTKGNPQLTQIPIAFGKITQVMVFFPPGLNGLAHIKLLYGLQQLFPGNEQADFAGGDVLINWAEDIDITHEPSKLTAVAWNDDNTYDHTITVHVVMTPRTPSTNVADVLAQVRAMQSATSSGTPSG